MRGAQAGGLRRKKKGPGKHCRCKSKMNKGRAKAVSERNEDLKVEEKEIRRSKIKYGKEKCEGEWRRKCNKFVTSKRK